MLAADRRSWRRLTETRAQTSRRSRPNCRGLADATIAHSPGDAGSARLQAVIPAGNLGGTPRQASQQPALAESNHDAKRHAALAADLAHSPDYVGTTGLPAPQSTANEVDTTIARTPQRSPALPAWRLPLTAVAQGPFDVARRLNKVSLAADSLCTACFDTCTAGDEPNDGTYLCEVFTVPWFPVRRRLRLISAGRRCRAARLRRSIRRCLGEIAPKVSPPD